MTNELTCLGSVLQNRWSLIRHCLESACFSLNKIRVCMVFKEIGRRYFSQTESTYVTKQRVFFLRVRVQNKCHSSSAMLVIDIRTKKKRFFGDKLKLLKTYLILIQPTISLNYGLQFYLTTCILIWKKINQRNLILQKYKKKVQINVGS